MGVSSFDQRTDSWSAIQYFQFYSYLSQQQNMMQDYIRTSTYQRAILSNAAIDFRGKVVLDVGAGSGILSFFAIQAGATKVYAVEASNMAGHCNTLVQANKLAGRIVVISGKIEEVTLPEPVDIIISEPMGYMLYNERMLETYVHARKFLAPHLKQQIRGKSRSHRAASATDSDGNGMALDGDRLSDSDQSQASDHLLNDETMDEGDDQRTKKPCPDQALPLPGVMFPTVANLYIVPFSDEALFAEQYAKANFWYQNSFHGMDLTALRSAAVSEYFNQPIVDTFDIGLCPAVPCVHKVDFRTVSEDELTSIDIPLHFDIVTCSTIHGLAFWFDVGFLGSQRDVWLSTAPTEPLTHWYQVRCLLGTPLFVQEGQSLNGHVTMRANSRQSYDVEIELIVPGSQTKITNNLDLKNPHFRYNGYTPAPPPGSYVRSPTETYYANLCVQNQQQQQQLQIQTAQSTGWTVPLANAATGVPLTAATVAAAAAAGATPMATVNSLFTLNPAVAVANAATLLPAVQPLPQSMQLSPQPTGLETPSIGLVQPNTVIVDGNIPASAGVGCAASSAAAVVHPVFYNPIAAGVGNETHGSSTGHQSANGWRADSDAARCASGPVYPVNTFVTTAWKLARYSWE